MFQAALWRGPQDLSPGANTNLATVSERVSCLADESGSTGQHLGSGEHRARTPQITAAFILLPAPQKL